jgi:methylmalonyl-CoA mutase
MNLPLFSEFSTTSKEAWKQQAIKDLKGKDFDENLLWHTAEGMVVQPYYASEDLTDDRITEVQQAQQKPLGWLNQPRVVYENEKITNAQMRAVLQKGADAILLDLNGIAADLIDFSKLFNHLKLSDTPVYFQTQGQETAVLAALQKFIPYQMKGGLADDGLAHWMSTGQMTDRYFESLAEVLKNTQSSPQFRIVCVSSHVFHNAGANVAQELAFTLASAVTYVDKLTDLGLSAAEVFAKLYFSVSVGTNYFMEIAKLRALRYLWKQMQRAWGVGHGDVPCYIHAQTSTFYDAAITSNTNLLRATTEAMSAVIGGCDTLTVHPFDAALKAPDDFSERIARNISTVLKEEGHLDKSVDAAAGSYYLENLTLQLADAAWKLFLETEQKGGLMDAFVANEVQNAIEENFQNTLGALQTGKRIMVGVNKFRFDEPNAAVVPKSASVRYEAPFKLLENKRISESFEQ